MKVQNDFTHGELDPKLVSRTDIQLYDKSAQRLRNVLVIPQGGAKRRFGTRYIAEITAASGEYLLRSFIYDDDDKYLLVFTDSNIAVYKNGVFKVNITTSYAGADIPQLKISQTFNLMVITHPDFPMATLVRGADDVTWTFADATIKKYPAYDFGDVDYSNDYFYLSVAGPVVNATVTNNTNATFFNDDYVGGLFTSLGDDNSLEIGVMQLVANPSTPAAGAAMTGDITSKFNSSVTGAGDKVKGVNCFVGKNAWNATNGYPICSTFHEGRLIVGGSRDLPQTIFMSVVNDKFDFDIGTGRDSDSIQLDISTSSINFVQHIVSDRTLQVFTDTAEFAVPQIGHEALTPVNSSIRKQTNNGSEDIEPVVIDNQTFYVRKGGKALMAFSYDDSTQSYQSTPVSQLAPHLMQNPVDMAARKSSSTDDADYLFIVNGTGGENPGSLVAYQSVSLQNVGAFTLCETEGKFKRIESVGGDETYFIVERVIDGATVQYLEVLDFDVYTDCAILQNFGAPTTTITGLSHLEGETVTVKADGYYIGDYEVDLGKIELDVEVTDTEVGFRYDVEIKPMPVNVNTEFGSLIFSKKRIPRVFVDYYESLGILVDGTVIKYLEFGDPGLFDPPVPKTGIYEHINLSDTAWDRRQAPVLTQTAPFPMLVLAVGYEVDL